MSENSKKMLSLIIFLMIIVGIIILGIVMVLMSGKDEDNMINIADNTQVVEKTETTEIQPIKDFNKLLIVENCINDYCEVNQDASQTIIFTPLQVDTFSAGTVERYYVYGMIEDVNYSYMGETYFIVDLDTKNKCFLVEQIKYEVNNLNEIENDTNTKNIQPNGGNLYHEQEIGEEDIAKYYFKTLKKILLGKPETAYELFDSEYRTNKFGNLEGLKKYIADNRERIISSQLYRYQILDYSGYKQYVLLDKNERYYIVNEYGVYNIKVILDTYTIDLPQFVKKYNSAIDEKKVGYNIQKVIDAINEQDYKYVYNKLDTTFRKNNFDSLDKFENYMKQHFFEKNTVKYEEVQKNGTTYVYNLTITDTSKNNNQTIKKNFIVKLLEGTNFVMSFNLE